MTSEDLKKLAEEISFPGDKWAPKQIFGERIWHGDILAKTIESALQSVRNETIDECAKIVSGDYHNYLAKCIRALKEPHEKGLKGFNE